VELEKVGTGENVRKREEVLGVQLCVPQSQWSVKGSVPSAHLGVPPPAPTPPSTPYHFLSVSLTSFMFCSRLSWEVLVN
jgi:hypothetical protein